MEQKELISNIADLMNVIKEDYKAKASNKWLIISLFLLLGLSLFTGVKDATSFMDFLRNNGSTVLLAIILLISLLKNLHFFSKIGASETATELLKAHDRHRETDKYLLVALVLMYSLYFYIVKGFTWTCFVNIGVLLALSILLFILFKDKNIERLRNLVTEQEGKK